MRKYETYCGVYCGACTIMKANENNTVDILAEKWETEPEHLRCDGCKSDVNYYHCADCRMKKCNIERGYENCSECDDFPCDIIREFNDDEYIHHRVVIRDLNEIRETGVSIWLQKQENRWKCSECGTRFTWYEEKCSNCGAELYNSIKELEDI